MKFNQIGLSMPSLQYVDWKYINFRSELKLKYIDTFVITALSNFLLHI